MESVKWTEQEVDILKEMATGGFTEKEITRVLKSRTVHAINQKCKNTGIVLKSREPEIDFDAFKSMLKTMRKPSCV